MSANDQQLAPCPSRECAIGETEREVPSISVESHYARHAVVCKNPIKCPLRENISGQIVVVFRGIMVQVQFPTFFVIGRIEVNETLMRTTGR